MEILTRDTPLSYLLVIGFSRGIGFGLGRKIVIGFKFRVNWGTNIISLVRTDNILESQNIPLIFHRFWSCAIATRNSSRKEFVESRLGISQIDYQSESSGCQRKHQEWIVGVLLGFCWVSRRIFVIGNEKTPAKESSGFSSACRELTHMESSTRRGKLPVICQKYCQCLLTYLSDMRDGISLHNALIDLTNMVEHAKWNEHEY